LSQVALITGGGGGIGSAVARRMAAGGIEVVLADYDSAAAQAVKDEIIAAGGKADARTVDVTLPQEVRAMVAGVAGSFGQIDIVANIAGGSPYTQRLEEFTLAQWKEVIDINLKGTFLVCREVAPIMQKQKRGRIINTASNYGVTGSALRTPYAAAKAGIIAFTKTLALELASDHVLANTVAPGPTDTPRVMQKESAEARQQRWWPHIPLGRTAQPEEIAEMYYFLTTAASAAITGQTFHVNGGVVMP